MALACDNDLVGVGAIVKDAEKLAADAEWAAKIREMHARELEGK